MVSPAAAGAGPGEGPERDQELCGGRRGNVSVRVSQGDDQQTPVSTETAS